MRNDSFIPGALVFAFALRKQNTIADLIAIVTHDVSEDAKNALFELYDDVITVEEIYVPHKERHTRQDRPFLFTRFHALRLGVGGDLGKTYKKIILADADVLPLEGYDCLFDLPSPSGVINEKKAYCVESDKGHYIIPDSVYQNETWIWHKQYKDIPHGSKIPKAMTDRVIEDPSNMGMNAALYLLEPDIGLFYDIMTDVKDEEVKDMIATFPWPEMQYITQKLSGKWHNIDLKYTSFNGYPMIDILNGIHYAGLKPWKRNHRSIKHFAKNEDYRLWYAVYEAMIGEHQNLLKRHLPLAKLHAFINQLYEHEEYHFKRPYLSNIKHLFER
jgi:glycogenin glucosyltransferase